MVTLISNDILCSMKLSLKASVMMVKIDVNYLFILYSGKITKTCFKDVIHEKLLMRERNKKFNLSYVKHVEKATTVRARQQLFQKYLGSRFLPFSFVTYNLTNNQKLEARACVCLIWWHKQKRSQFTSEKTRINNNIIGYIIVGHILSYTDMTKQNGITKFYGSSVAGERVAESIFRLMCTCLAMCSRLYLLGIWKMWHRMCPNRKHLIKASFSF